MIIHPFSVCNTTDSKLQLGPLQSHRGQKNPISTHHTSHGLHPLVRRASLSGHQLLLSSINFRILSECTPPSFSVPSLSTTLLTFLSSLISQLITHLRSLQHLRQQTTFTMLSDAPEHTRVHSCTQVQSPQTKSTNQISFRLIKHHSLLTSTAFSSFNV